MTLARPNPAPGLPRSVWLLGWVSLATDAATEAVYPLLPLFLIQVLGASAVSLGIIEGAAEAVNSGLKIVAGRLADRARAKRPLVLIGYTVSSLVRPLVAVAQTWTHVFIVRVIDRVGKGVRGAPRDAMLATFATPDTRGKVFGFHRAMDHTGAVIGPVLASVFLWLYPGEYRTLFALAIVPGVIAIVLIFFVREDPAPAPQHHPAAHEHARGAALGPTLTSFLVVYSLFTLGNSTDAFLLLRLGEVAGASSLVPLMWAALHVVKAASSLVGGRWSDRVGRRRIIAIGWLVYVVVYAGFAVSSTLPVLLAWFLVYGLYFGLTEGVEKALIADLSHESNRGAAFGVFGAIQGIGALAASVIFGVVWTTFGPPAAFLMGAALALLATILLFFTVPGPARHR